MSLLEDLNELSAQERGAAAEAVARQRARIAPYIAPARAAAKALDELTTALGPTLRQRAAALTHAKLPQLLRGGDHYRSALYFLKQVGGVLDAEPFHRVIKAAEAFDGSGVHPGATTLEGLADGLIEQLKIAVGRPAEARAAWDSFDGCYTAVEAHAAGALGKAVAPPADTLPALPPRGMRILRERPD